MSYEAHIAGVGDRPPGRPLTGLAIGVMQRAAARDLAVRRAALVATVHELAPVRFVNGGGTGSVERTAREPAVTEVAAGSGLFGPALFDAYRAFRPRPAAFFVLPVVRKPDPATATALGGRLSGVGRRRARPAAAARAAARAAPGPARGRRRGADPAAGTRARRSSRSATGCGCATRRRASCASASSACT